MRWLLLLLILTSCASKKHKEEKYISVESQNVIKSENKTTNDSIGLKIFTTFTELLKEKTDSVVVTHNKVIYYGIKKETEKHVSTQEDFTEIKQTKNESTENIDTLVFSEQQKIKDKSNLSIGLAFFIFFIFLIFIFIKRFKLF